MGLFTQTKEQFWNLHFFDDHSYIFRQLEVSDGWMLERDSKGNVDKAFMQPYKLQKQFDGFKNIPACKLIVTFNRDILFDPFNQLTLTEKPKKGMGLKETMMSKLATAKAYRNEKEAKPTNSLDKMILFLGGVIVILAISVLIQIATNQGG